jgi:hypothetical protein
MKRTYSLFHLFYVLLISLFLQSCSGLGNLPIEGGGESTETIELEEQGRRKRVRIELEGEQQQRLIEQGQSISLFNIFPSEIWQEIFSYLKFEDILLARAVNSDWNELITGFRQAGVVGVENRPQHIIDTGHWIKNKAIIFSSAKLKELTPAIIPSFAFYHLIGYVKNLGKEFWPYLQGTRVHTVDLTGGQIDAQGLENFAKYLQGTRVHTVNLYNKKIHFQGLEGFARLLQGTQVHKVNWYCFPNID